MWQSQPTHVTSFTWIRCNVKGHAFSLAVGGWFAAILSLGSPAARAQTSPSPLRTGPVTNCSTGCTIITCNASTCTVHYCDTSGCKAVGSYPRPRQTNRVSGPPAVFPTGQAETLSPSDAPLQFATACSKNGRDCMMWAVKPEGASFIGYYNP